MSNEPSSPAGGGNDLATLLKEGASSSSLEPAAELSKRLGPGATEKLAGVIENTVAEGQLELADSMLIMTERAAQLAGADAVWNWARVGRGMIALMQGNDARAESLFEEGFENLDASSTLGDRALLHAYAVAGDWLCDRALRAKDVAGARELLARMLLRASAESAADIEARVITKLLWLSLSIGDLESAEEHALRLIGGPGWDAASGKTLENIVLLLRSAASNLYEEGETNYESVRLIAREVINKAGPDGSMMLLLATAAFTLEDFADSLSWLDKLLEAPQELLSGYDVTSLYMRRTYCLLYLNRRGEAVESVQQATQAAPDDPYARWGAAQVFVALGDHKLAINEFTETIRLCEQRMANAKPDSQPSEQPRSMKEYEASVPVEDLRDFAILSRAASLRATGSKSEAEADLQTLVSVGDEVSRASALSTLAEWEEEESRLNDAAELLARALALNSGSPNEIALRLASVFIGLGSYKEALDLIATLSHKSRKPEECVELLNKIPRSWEGYARVDKWRGYAKTEAGWPREGFADLDAAVKADPSDGEALFLRALARITFGVKSDQEDWNSSRTLGHIRESLEDLYATLRLSPDHEEARRVIKWLVERAAADQMMYEMFTAGGTRDGDLFKVFPDLSQAFTLAWQANDLGFEREWDQCARVWAEARQAYESAGFEIMATRVNIRLMDAYLRLLDFDEVAAHLERAEQLRFLINVPLSRDVLDQYNDMVAIRGAYQQQALGLEIEYNWIYGLGFYDEMKLLLIKGNYLHRLGDVTGALECVDQLKPVLEDLPSYLDNMLGIEEVLWVVAILRDGGRYDDALRLLDSLQAHAEEMDRSFDILYMRGLIHDTKGEPQLALDAFERAIAVIGERARPVGVGPYIQYASSLLNVGRDADAAEVLEKIDIEQDAGSDRDRLYFYTVEAWVYGTRRDYQKALDAVEKGIAIVEQRRAEIAAPASRSSWQGQYENLFSIAVKLYVDTNQPLRAWRAVELSKARTLLEEIAGRDALSPQYATLVADLETVERATQIVEREINREEMQRAAAALRTEAAAELARLLERSFKDILASDSFTKRDFPAVRDMLVARHRDISNHERRMRDAVSKPAGSMIGFDEVARLVKE